MITLYFGIAILFNSIYLYLINILLFVILDRVVIKQEEKYWNEDMILYKEVDNYQDVDIGIEDE